MLRSQRNESKFISMSSYRGPFVLFAVKGSRRDAFFQPKRPETATLGGLEGQDAEKRETVFGSHRARTTELLRTPSILTGARPQRFSGSTTDTQDGQHVSPGRERSFCSYLFPLWRQR